jgi:GNAT superfamily N-acetyltransferase
MVPEGYSYEASFAEAERDFIQLSLQKHGNQYAPGVNARAVEIALRDSSGQLVGGLLGCTAWEWLIIDMLWISEELRSQGLGKELLARAERRSIQLGCTDARTETFDFQALPFYKKYGYEVYGQLDGFPAGHTEFQLRKRLV